MQPSGGRQPQPGQPAALAKLGQPGPLPSGRLAHHPPASHASGTDCPQPLRSSGRRSPPSRQPSTDGQEAHRDFRLERPPAPVPSQPGRLCPCPSTAGRSGQGPTDGPAARPRQPSQPCHAPPSALVAQHPCPCHGAAGRGRRVQPGLPGTSRLPPQPQPAQPQPRLPRSRQPRRGRLQSSVLPWPRGGGATTPETHTANGYGEQATLPPARPANPKASQASPGRQGPGLPAANQTTAAPARARKPQARTAEPASGPFGQAKLGPLSARPNGPGGGGHTPAQKANRPASKTRETTTAGSRHGGARGPPRSLSPTNRRPRRAATPARPTRPHRGPGPGPATTGTRAPAGRKGQPDPGHHRTNHSLSQLPRSQPQGALGPPSGHLAPPPSPRRAGSAAGPVRPAQRPSPGPATSARATSPTGRPGHTRAPGPRAQGPPGGADLTGQPLRQPTEGGRAGEVHGAGHLLAAARAAAIAAHPLPGPPTHHLTNNRHPKNGHNTTDFALPVCVRRPEAPARPRRAPGSPGYSSPATSHQP